MTKPASSCPRAFCLLIFSAFGLLPISARAQFSGQKTYCNPIDINYQYNFEQKARGISFRSGADPVIVNHRGDYFLFVTISGGWWHSKDLVNWRFVKPDVAPHAWPKEDMCAPAALSVGDKLYLFQSTFERRPIWVSTAPQTGRLTQFNPLLPQVPAWHCGVGQKLSGMSVQFSCRQRKAPPAELQKSTVHGLPSAQFRGSPTQSPP